jgi:hypothetical protein
VKSLNHIKSRLCQPPDGNCARLDVLQQGLAVKPYFFLLVFFFFAFLAFLAILPSANPVGSMQVDIDMHMKSTPQFKNLYAALQTR